MTGCESVDTFEEGGDVFLMTIVEKAPAEIDGKALSVVARYGYLSLNLPLGGIQLGRGQWLVYHTLQLFRHQSFSLFHVVRVTTEIYAPHARVAIACHRAFHGVDKAIAFAKRHV